MKKQDTRLLSPDAQEALRRRVMAAIQQDKLTPTQAAERFGVSRQSIYPILFTV